MVPDESLQQEARDWAARLAQAAPLSVRHVKKLLRAAMEQGLEATIDQESVRQNECITSKDFAEGVSAFFEKRSPAFKGRRSLITHWLQTRRDFWLSPVLGAARSPCRLQPR